MASINWAKYKTPNEVKAHIRHNEKQCRMATKEHNNQHINRALTANNYSIMGRSYADRCKIYDDAMTALKPRRKDAVTCLSLETAVPENIPDEQVQEWCERYHAILCDFFGSENILDTDVHVDEIHEYIDARTKERKTSRVHTHTHIIPRTSDGRLCCKEVSARNRIIELNRQVDEMTQQEFGLEYNTKKSVRSKSVEQLKAESLQLQVEEQQETLSTLLDVMHQVPKQRVFGKKSYKMSEQEHDEWIQLADNLQRYANNALVSDTTAQDTAKRLAEIEQFKSEQRAWTEKQAKIQAKYLARPAIARAKEREQAAEKARQEAEQEKQQAQRAKQRYKDMCDGFPRQVMIQADKIARKISEKFGELPRDEQVEMIKQYTRDELEHK